MPSFSLILSLLLVFFFSGCVASHSLPATSADVLGGKDVVETIRSAETVEVFRLKDRGYTENLADFEVADGPLIVSESLAEELAEVVTAYDSYEREVKVGCAPIYHVRTRFVRGESTVDVVYCFQCAQLTVFHNGKLVGGALFQPAEARFTSIAKRMLPDDKALQQLE